MGSAQTIILDGAHNPAGVEALRAAMEKHFPERRVALVFGVMQDKNWQAMCQTLAPLANRILLAPVGSDRSASPPAMREFCHAHRLAAETVACSSLAEALALTSADPLVLITGSLHFVGEATEALNLCNSPLQNERGLNEWTAGSRLV
jgi:dihydrofolate synthase/folylpolyglutamate synthase